ncbi:MAG: type III-A CRISPR-associated RAMP protein Csm4 [Prevotellaceae bacterium]|jgi:CRISPR type III-A-associated RAMP protein Csm4|nr:type III-A CRISPR-associated RAMP protein Csm4 [Prevotellaceae bacterium]
MPKYNIVKLTNLTPLHIGTGKQNQYDSAAADLHSDTLSAALAALRAQRGNTNDTEAFLNSFTLSSAFPFWGNTLFLPRLQGKMPVKVAGKEENEYGKQLKKLKYIDAALWNELVKGKSLTVEPSQLEVEEFLLKTDKDFEQPFKSQINRRITAPRTGNQDAEPFFFHWTYYHAKSGLYCLTDAQGAKFDETVNLFKLLGETGLGTDKNSGGGKFEVETDTITLPDVTGANHTLLLSLYIPEETEMPKLRLSAAQYGLTLRGGYMAGSSEEHLRYLRKRSVYMFTAGSLFPTTAKLKGKTVNLTPDRNDEGIHPVYRSGKPFYLPVKTNVS